jgi:2,3-dihydroxybenzoate decarboxylase/5-carboxyvanillate decarboxylase
LIDSTAAVLHPGVTARPRRIATEEAFTIPEVVEALRQLCASPSQSADMLLLRRIYQTADSYQAGFLAPLLDLESARLADMDAHGVDLQLLSLTAPGVQLFDADTATELATIANDRLAAVIARHPKRFAGLASFAPHSPKRAVREMERAVLELGLNGFIVNSHTNNEYLDDPKYWPVLEAAEALDRCIYIHPRGPSDLLAGPLRDYGMFAALWAYGVEVGTHAVRLMLSGVFDRFPRLKICLGHMGEAVHFWLWRIDFMSARAQTAGAPRLKLTPSEYFRRNFVITTSGQESPLALDFSIRQLGIDNVMWAIDYPYQPTAPAVRFMDGVDVSDEDRAKLYHRNAERIFHIPPA